MIPLSELNTPKSCKRPVFTAWIHFESVQIFDKVEIVKSRLFYFRSSLLGFESLASTIFQSLYTSWSLDSVFVSVATALQLHRTAIETIEMIEAPIQHHHPMHPPFFSNFDTGSKWETIIWRIQTLMTESLDLSLKRFFNTFATLVLQNTLRIINEHHFTSIGILSERSSTICCGCLRQRLNLPDPWQSTARSFGAYRVWALVAICGNFSSSVKRSSNTPIHAGKSLRSFKLTRLILLVRETSLRISAASQHSAHIPW